MVDIPLPSAAPSFSSEAYWSAPVIERRADVAAPPLRIADIGTGGMHLREFVLSTVGYPLRDLVVYVQGAPEPALHVRQMEQVKAGFGRTMSRLPEVFGVSRQTLYNWLNGETPKDAHLGRLHELAEAAAVFSKLGFKPTAPLLDRTLMQGKSFLQLLAQGENGKELAKKLVRVHQRSDSARAKLDAILGGQKARPTAEDFGAPAFKEDV